MSVVVGPSGDLEAPGAENWFGAEAVKSLHELNECLIKALSEDLQRPNTDARIRLAIELRDVLAGLDPEHRARAASCPIALIDAGFRDEARWVAVASGQPTPAGTAGADGEFAHLRAVQLAQMTLTLASTTAEISVERACLVFGMSPLCARVLASLTLHRIQELAERHADWVRPRWEHQPSIWRSLLDLASRPPSRGVPSVGIRAMQLQLADLTRAPGICAAIRQIRR